MAIHTGEARLRDEGNYVGQRDHPHGAAASRSPTAARCWCRRRRTTSWSTSCPTTSSSRPRHAPPEGPRPARARVAARPCRASSRSSRRCGRSTPSRTTCRSPCRRSSVASTRSTRSSASSLDNRLVTLMGPGGAGKTRLAQQVGGRGRRGVPRRRVVGRPRRRHGPDAGRRRRSAARTARPRGPRRPPRRGRAAAGRKRVLLILDNCEHLARRRAPRRPRRSCASCSDVAVLATSRAPLNVPGELSWRVPPLGLRSDADASVEAVANSDAVRLFADRATRGRQRLPPHRRERGRRRRDLRPARRHPAGHRAGGGAVPGADAGADPRRARRLARAARRRPADGADRATRPSSASIEWSHSLLADADAAAVPAPGRVRVAVHPRGRRGGGGRRRLSAGAGARRSSSTSSTSRSCRWTTSASAALPPARDRAPVRAPGARRRRGGRRARDRHAAYFRARALGLWPLFHDGHDEPPRHGRRRATGIWSRCSPTSSATRRPRSTRRSPWPACPPSACGTSPRRPVLGERRSPPAWTT